jgi:glycosyltransferase involved in cell wall biosynthesis
MKILFVAMDNSTHTYRWVKYIMEARREYEFFLYPSFHIPGMGEVFSEKDPIEIYKPGRVPTIFETIRNHPIKYLKILLLMGLRAVHQAAKEEIEKYNNKTLQLLNYIKKINPNIIHTLHTQTSGYQLLEVRKIWEGPFPKWVHSVWGSDLFLYRKWLIHRTILSGLFSFIDYFIGEGIRDQSFAKELGFKGHFFDPLPASGGFNIESIKNIRGKVKPSERKQITIKGYQNAVGRYFVGLRALERARDLLDGYEINTFLIQNEETKAVTDLFEINNSLKVNLHLHVPYEQILEMHARSRISIGLSTSDGLPASFLEAMAMGAFPIQSNTSLASEWVSDGKTAFIVPPEDPEVIEQAIRKALTDDVLVDAAAETNWNLIQERLSSEVISHRICSLYDFIEKDSQNEH